MKERRIVHPQIRGVRAMYPAAIVNFGHSIDVALDISMDYLERTKQATDYWETHATVTSAILTAWKGGVRHHIRLALNVHHLMKQRAGRPFSSVSSKAKTSRLQLTRPRSKDDRQRSPIILFRFQQSSLGSRSGNRSPPFGFTFQCKITRGDSDEVYVDHCDRDGIGYTCTG
jgi:hypothetical protein